MAEREAAASQRCDFLIMLSIEQPEHQHELNKMVDGFMCWRNVGSIGAVLDQQTHGSLCLYKNP